MKRSGRFSPQATAPAIDYAAIFALSPNPYVLLAPDLVIVEANGAYLRTTMRTRSEIIGRTMFEAFPGGPEGAEPEHVRQLRGSFTRVLETRRPDTLALIRYPIPRATPTGTVFEDRYWSATHTPLLDADGEVRFILQHTVDVTELHRLRSGSPAPLPSPEGTAPGDQVETGVLRRARAVQAANWRLDAERQRLRRLFQQAPGFVAVLRGPDHRFELTNDAFAELIGHRDVIGRPLATALPEIRAQGHIATLDTVFATGEPFVGSEVRVLLQRRSSGPAEERHLDFVFQPIMDPDDRVTGIFVQGVDVTERRLAQAHQRLLLDELNHRVKNTLATVQAIASQTARGAASVEAFSLDFQARLKAMARTHDALTRRSWTGAELRDLLEQELRPYGFARVALDGEAVELTPRMALTLGMVFHELATNAAKHGALSVPQGRVDVAWSATRPPDGAPAFLRLTWRESDGPTVPPRTRRGFGSRLIEGSVASELSGKVTLDLPPQGLSCELVVPLAAPEAA